ncbi:putative membrane protein [Oscillochloris trichoides DG-6]|uniref:Membrane protein n=1 Tax=Oscillochloris trichoides DG-6 TaxID=765420 RepID=E1IAL0_9CHLR|nr:hemolysin III family protein [Oscillochloris trichoides]EFO81784.1 putative membrane protein [Oscillochloris trichoides DG-6]
MKSQAVRRHEELANTLTHGAGAVASLAAGSVLTGLAMLSGDVWRIIGAAVFSLTLVLLYTASTLYHSATQDHIKKRMKIFDHCAIYLLIAGTYTPFTLVSLHGAWGWSLFGVIWSLAIAGVVFKLIFTNRFKLISTLFYIGMGWLVVVAIVPMTQTLPASTLAWLVAGGLAYTAGTLFYHNQRIPFSHAIWHLFVIAGSVCHFVAVSVTLV